METRLFERISLGKAITTDQPRTFFFQFTLQQIFLAIDQLPHVDHFNGILVGFFMIWFPLAVYHLYGSFYPFA